MFIMDFDRHEDQWRWATNDTGEKKTYVAIPRDRDQAFFINNGFIPKQVAKPYRMPKFQGFRARCSVNQPPGIRHHHGCTRRQDLVLTDRIEMCGGRIG